MNKRDIRLSFAMRNKQLSTIARNRQLSLATTILIMLFAIISLTACNSSNNQEETSMVNIPRDKFNHGSSMNFIFRIIIDGEAHFYSANVIDEFIHPQSSHYPNYTTLVFVHNEQEAIDGDFDDSVILAWPRDDGFTKWLLIGINDAISQENINPQDFNLSNPIIVQNLVDNWEDVSRLWNAISSNEQSWILRDAELMVNNPPQGE